MDTYLFVLARHDVGHAQVSQNNGADVEDLWDRAQLLIQSQGGDGAASKQHTDQNSKLQTTPCIQATRLGEHTPDSSTRFTEGFLLQGHS